MNKRNLLTVLLALCLTSLPVMADGLLHEAAKEGDVAKIRTLLNKGAQVNARSKGGFTPLHDAALNGHVEAIRVLLEAGADVNARAEDGDTPLHQATRHVEAIRALLRAGADVNPRDKGEFTPLHFAAFWGRVEAVRALLKAGALVNAKNKYECSPVDSARMGMMTTEDSVAPFEEIIEVLRAAGGRLMAGCANFRE